MKRWLDGRQGNSAALKELYPILAPMNGVRERLGLGEVDLAEAKGFPEREEAEEVVEKGQMDQAARDYGEAWETLYEAMDEGVEQLYELAKKGEQNKPSFGQALLSALLTAAAGNVLGVIAKGLFAVAADDAVKAAIAELVNAVVSDTSQAVIAPAIGEVIAGAGDDVDLKALLFVRGGLKEICRRTKSQHVKALNGKIATGKMSVAQVRGAESAVRKSEKAAMTRLKSASATDWVRYVAQSSVGGDQSKGVGGSVSGNVTNLDNYYGESVPSGPRQAAYRRGTHEGAAGMLRVEVMTYEHSISGPASGLVDIREINANKLNKEMAELLLAGENVKTLNDLKVPKEVHVKYKVFKGRNTYDYPTLKMVVDEDGGVQESLPEEGAPTDTSVWQDIRKAPINPSMIK